MGALMCKWLNDDGGHIFTRKHILRLLIPFSKSYDKSCWKKSSSMARAIMQKQWMEKAPKFLQFVTPALIAIYEGSENKLKKWREDLLEAMKSEQPQIRMSVWDFLAKICIIGDIGEYNVSASKASKDIKDVMNDSSMMSALKHALLEDQDKATRDAAAKFVYGARNLVGTGRLDYEEIRKDKRASMALDVAADLYNRDVRILKGLKAPTDEEIAKKHEKKQAKSSQKGAKKRKNNLRAQMRAARKLAKKQGGGGQLELLKENDDDDDDKEDKDET